MIAMFRVECLDLESKDLATSQYYEHTVDCNVSLIIKSNSDSYGFKIGIIFQRPALAFFIRETLRLCRGPLFILILTNLHRPGCLRLYTLHTAVPLNFFATHIYLRV